MDFIRQTDFQVELGGELVEIKYRWGILSPSLREHLVRGGRAKYYYQGNIPTQGIDVRLGKRVISTAQLETIWKAGDGSGSLVRHNSFNEFVGELLIPDLPRGLLGTVNNKTSFDLSDPDWEKIFQKLDELAPPPRARKETEEGLKKQWMGYLKATNPEDKVTDEYAVWPTATYIDVLQEKADGRLCLYELKTKAAEPLNLYQLKMYWDGLVLAGREPEEAVLIAKSYTTAMEQMAQQMNRMESPRLPGGKGSKSYNFRLATHEEKCLGKMTEE